MALTIRELDPTRVKGKEPAVDSTRVLRTTQVQCHPSPPNAMGCLANSDGSGWEDSTTPNSLERAAHEDSTTPNIRNHSTGAEIKCIVRRRRWRL